MSKVLSAECEAGEVKALGVAVDGANILSAGEKKSTGVLVLEGETQTYITSNASDIKALIDLLSQVIDGVISVATVVDGIAAGSQTANIATLNTLKSDLDQMEVK